MEKAAKKSVTRPPESRSALVTLLTKDNNMFVRIEAAKTMGYIGANEPEWTEPLIDVLTDESIDTSVRFQAYRAVAKLTGRDDPFVPSYWRRPKRR